jgi:DNA-binding protein YbaB
MVSVEMLGNFKLTAVKFKPESVDPDDTEMLEDLVTAAINDVCGQVLKAREALTGGVI